MILQLNESPCRLKKVATADTPMQQFPPRVYVPTHQWPKYFSSLQNKKREGQTSKRKHYAITRCHWQLTLHYILSVYIVTPLLPPLPTRCYYPVCTSHINLLYMYQKVLKWLKD